MQNGFRWISTVLVVAFVWVMVTPTIAENAVMQTQPALLLHTSAKAYSSKIEPMNLFHKQASSQIALLATAMVVEIESKSIYVRNHVEPIQLQETISMDTVTEPPIVQTDETQAQHPLEAIVETPDQTAMLTPMESIPPQQYVTAEATPETEHAQVAVHVYYRNDHAYNFGDTLTLEATFEGLNEVTYTMQWQYFDGFDWHDQPGATEDRLSFILTNANAAYVWRLAVAVS